LLLVQVVLVEHQVLTMLVQMAVIVLGLVLQQLAVEEAEGLMFILYQEDVVVVQMVIQVVVTQVCMGMA
jgi:hypothetical protein